MSIDELDLVRAIGSDAWPIDAATRRRVRARLDVAMAEDRVVRPGRAARPVRHRPRWPILIPAAAVLAVIVIVVQVVLPGGPTAAQAFDRLADVAAARPTPTLGSGSYFYERSESLDVHEDENLSTGRVWRVTVPTERELWVAPDGSGRILARSGDPEFLSPSDEQAWVAEGSPPLSRGGSVRDEAYGAGELPFVDLGDLPVDPERLRDMIVAREILPGPAGHAENLRIVGDLLRETVGPPAVRAALFRAAAMLPGIELVGDVQDHVGRAGVAVSAADGDATVTLIFDADSSELLEIRDQIAGVQTWRTVLGSGETEGAEARP